jgi:hypothetical protein
VAVIPIFETIHECRICSSLDLHEILDLGNQPPANSIYLPDKEDPLSIPLRLVFCRECGTAQLGESVDPHYLFSKYLWVTGTSKTALEYSYRFVSEALSRCERENPFVVEIASNDGTFLRRFLENGCRVLGIDPAENIAQIASEAGVPTSVNFFNQRIAGKLLEEQGTANIVVARNVIPHVKEIHSVIKGIYILLDEGGTGIIEFHDSRLIQDELQYDYIYHEHLFYFSLGSIGYLLRRHGLEIYDVGRSSISGGSWVVYFSKATKKKSSAFLHAEREEKKSDMNNLDSWLAFSNKAKSHRDQLNKIICASKNKILAYGASARSSTLLNFCGISHQHISAAIDKNSLKHGMQAPGSKIPIISYEEGLQQFKENNLILLLAWNFREEVVESLRNSGYKGQFIYPLPGEPRIQ